MMEKIKEFVVDLKDYITDNPADSIKAFIAGAINGFILISAASGAVLNICYWMKHPEWALNSKCKDLLRKNLGE